MLVEVSTMGEQSSKVVMWIVEIYGTAGFGVNLAPKSLVQEAVG